MRLPFNLTSSKFYTQLSVSNYVGSTRVTDFENSINNGGRLIDHKISGFLPYFFEAYPDYGYAIYNSFNLNFYSLLKKSTRDINSKWGAVFDIKSNTTPYGGNYEGKHFSLLGQFYLPGLAKHHSLWGYWAFQSSQIKYGRTKTNAEFLDGYIFRNQIPTARGLSDYIARSEKMYSMSANYTMPVWYPDIALGPWINIKRLRLNGFVDYVFGDNPALRSLRPNSVSQRTYASAGGELKLDVNLMRFLPELDLGIRYSYGLKPSISKFEFLIGTFNF